jgi:aryl-alcohol dehydrogenase-like predicted oxidoreductase
MQLHPLGKSNLYVTRLGLGLAALGRPGYINLGHARDLDESYDVSVMEAHAHEVLDAAWAAGIRYFDAARSYGRAEAFLSTWLNTRAINPDTVTVGSKWGYTYTADWQIQAEHHEIKEHSLPVLQRQIGESRSLLGGQLDLYQIHSATLASGVLENDAVLGELARLRDSGLHIGLSLSGPNQAETLTRAVEIERDGRPLFTAVQATWNLMAQEAGEALSQANAAGMGVIVKEALANGRLTPRNLEPSFQQRRILLDQIAAQNNITIDAVALAAVLAQPWADVVLSGAANVDHLHSNLKANAVTLEQDLPALMEMLQESPVDYWETRNNLPWN